MNFHFTETTNEELAEQRVQEALRVYGSIVGIQKKLNHLKKKYNDLADSVNELSDKYRLDRMGE